MSGATVEQTIYANSDADIVTMVRDTCRALAPVLRFSLSSSEESLAGADGCNGSASLRRIAKLSFSMYRCQPHSRLLHVHKVALEDHAQSARAVCADSRIRLRRLHQRISMLQHIDDSCIEIVIGADCVTTATTTAASAPPRRRAAGPVAAVLYV